MAMINGTTTALQPSAQQAIANLPVPASMYMNQTIPPNYFNNVHGNQGKNLCIFLDYLNVLELKVVLNRKW